MKDMIIMIIYKIFERDSHFNLFKILGMQIAWNNCSIYVAMRSRVYNVHKGQWKA